MSRACRIPLRKEGEPESTTIAHQQALVSNLVGAYLRWGRRDMEEEKDPEIVAEMRRFEQFARGTLCVEFR